MLIKAKTIKGYNLNGTEGDIGSLKEFFFDDKYWTIRYLVVKTGRFFSRKQVLISPYFLAYVDYQAGLINIGLTKDEIENSPPLDSDRPVSRQFEEAYHGYHGAPVYWGGPLMWGSIPFIMREREKWKTMNNEEDAWDPNLRSTKDVTGHNIQALDEEIGHVDDFIIDDENWAIRYLVVDTKNWWPGKKVLVSTQWIDRFSWEDAKVFVQLNKEDIKQAPEYEEDQIITRDYESNLHQYYQRKEYWHDETVSRDHNR
jgi:uncharacterized protein YrrD